MSLLAPSFLRRSTGRSLLALWAMLGATVCAALPPLAGSRPNIIFILTDDQGYGDLSAHGNPILRTPQLDRLHAESVRFTDFHVSPTCSPTRSALLTGRHEFKNGVTHTIFERERLAPAATTLAQVLKSAGYATGIFGKWHLGDEPEYQPERRGFDEVFIHGGGGIGQVYPGSCGDAPRNTYFNPVILHNGTFERTEGYCTDVFFAQALRWIGARKDQSEPFFAYVATNAPHAPLQVRPEDEARYKGKVPDAATAKYFGMVANIDDNVGRLLDQLDAWGLRERTLVVFMNDNGGTGGVKVFNDGMRGQKGSPWLGGTRAASFWRWPGHLVPGEVGALTAHVDFFPTIAALARADLSAATQAQVEGRSLLPLLSHPRAQWPDRTLFTHVGRWARFANPDESKFTQCAVRTPRWHLVSLKGGATPAWELYDLSSDRGEKVNVVAAHPDVVATLARAYDAWWQEARVGMVNEQAVGPKLNPFAARYWQQFGGGPDADDLRVMEPTQRTIPRGRGAAASAP